MIIKNHLCEKSIKIKNIIYLFIISISISLQAQVKEVSLVQTQLQEINQTFVSYLSAIQNEDKDWTKITSYTYPPLFELFTKGDIVQKLKQAFDNSIYYTTFDLMEVLKENGSFVFDKVIYSKIIYNNQYTFHFKEDKDQTKKEYNLYLDFMTETFQNKFKEMKVIRVENNIEFKGEKTILAVFDPAVGAWKMLEYLENNEIYYSMFLPEEVATYLGN